MYLVTFKNTETVYCEKVYHIDKEYILPTDGFEYLIDRNKIDLYRELNPPKGPWDRMESGPVLIMGSGPSLKDLPIKEFKNMDIICCGRAHEHIKAKYLVAMDLECGSYNDSIADFKGKAVFIRPYDKSIHENEVAIERHANLCRVTDSLERGLYVRNSGMAAINIAYCLGYDPIYFMGLDCAVINGEPHFFEEKISELKKHIMREEGGYTNKKMEYWRTGLESQARLYKYRNVDVINLGPLFTLKNYLMMRWEDVLK